MNVTTATPGASTRSDGPFLPGYTMFGAMLAAAGLPIYIHAPKYFVDTYGVGLAVLGLVLFALRLLDFVQEPALGWLSDRLARVRGRAVTVATVVMAAAMLGLFAVEAPVPPVAWFALTLVVLFSSFSFLSISFYATGTVAGAAMGDRGHVRLSAWRETGTLLGVCLAAAAPTVLISFTDAPFTGFALGFAVFAMLALLAMRSAWSASTPVQTKDPATFREVLSDPITRRLLIVALLNAAPVAVSSTVFLFYVESLLGLPGWEGPLLILFFLAAAAAAPLWARAARSWGAKPVLLAGMVLSIVAFSVTLTLGSGDLLPFALVCLASGAALGADMTLLPAIFAARLSKVAPGSARAFGLWSFATKFTLAVAAGVVLPALEFFGFQSGETNPASALTALMLIYALLPCALKCVAVAVLLATPIEET